MTATGARFVPSPGWFLLDLVLVVASAGCATPGRGPLDRSSLACQQGSQDDCARQAEHEFLAWGTSFDPTHAGLLFQQACQGGVADACMRLGEFVAAGRGSPRDEARAARLTDDACTKGSWRACRFTNQSRRTEELVRAACDRGDGNACRHAVRWIDWHEGDKVQAAYDYAAALLATACGGGDARACADAGAARMDAVRNKSKKKEFDGTSPTVVVDIEAAALYRRGCDGGFTPACVELASMMLEQRPDEAAALLEKACSTGYPNSCGLLGTTYKDLSQARELFDKACEAGDGVACENLVGMYTTGTGVKQDAAKAKEVEQKGYRCWNPWYP